MRKYKKQNKRYKKKRYWGKGLLGRNRSSSQNYSLNKYEKKRKLRNEKIGRT